MRKINILSSGHVRTPTIWSAFTQHASRHGYVYSRPRFHERDWLAARQQFPDLRDYGLKPHNACPSPSTTQHTVTHHKERQATYVRMYDNLTTSLFGSLRRFVH